MTETEYLARNYTDSEVHELLLAVFSAVPQCRTPFYVRLLRRKRAIAPHARRENRS